MPCSPKNDPLFACLVLERGAPYEKGACFLLRQSKLTLGRSTSSCTPRYHVRQPADIPKTLLYRTARRGWSICELKKQTRHAAERRTAAPVLIRPLKHGDKIGLAANIVSLRFSLTPELDQTLDYNCADPCRALPCRNRPSPWSSTPRKSPCWSAARKLRCRRRNGSC